MNCAVCGEKGYVFHLREIHLSRHIQGVGQVVLPAVIKHKRVTIRVCTNCNQELENIIPNAVKNYHMEEEE